MEILIWLDAHPAVKVLIGVLMVAALIWMMIWLWLETDLDHPPNYYGRLDPRRPAADDPRHPSNWGI